MHSVNDGVVTHKISVASDENDFRPDLAPECPPSKQYSKNYIGTGDRLKERFQRRHFQQVDYKERQRMDDDLAKYVF